MQSLVTRFASLTVLLALVTTLAFGQGAQHGAITGLVRDTSGAMVSGATVEIINDSTGALERTLTTDSSGSFAAQLLIPGTYRVQVKAQGFKQYTAIVPVRLNETARHTATLSVGTVAETVSVEAAPTLVNTQSAAMGQPIDEKTLQALPLAVPNFMFLLSLSSGVAGEPTDVRGANRGIVDLNVNGQRTTNNSLTIEGINVNDLNLAHFDTVPLPNPNAISEFKTATSLYDASLGSKGGGAVALVLKSGTKDWHGDAYWNHRNDALNANEWFTKRAQLASGQENKPGRLLQNVYGASLSGPVPWIGGYWFGNIQGLRGRNGLDPNGSRVTAIIPVFNTNADGSTNAALLSTTQGISVPAANVDTTSLRILNLQSDLYGGTYLVPRPGQPGCGAPSSNTTGIRVMTCIFSKIAQIEDDQYTITYDRNFRDNKDKIIARWFWDNGTILRPFGTASSLAFPSAGIQRNRFAALGWTHQITNRQFNEARFGFTRFNSSFGPSDPISLADIGATRPNESTVPGIYRIAVTGSFSLGTGVNDERGTVSNQFHFTDTWSYAAGKHTWRAGGEYLRYQLNRYNRFAIRGALGFDNMSNFVDGVINNIQSASGDPQRYFRATDFSFFIQDDWRVHPRVTLNLGLRWEPLAFAHDKELRQNNYEFGKVIGGSPTNPFVFPEDVDLPGITPTPGIGKCGVKNCRDWNNLAPRFGIAWDLFGDGKTVLRGGYGIYFQRLSNQNLLQGSLGAPYFVQLIDTNPPVTMQNPLPGQPPATSVAPAFIPQLARFHSVVGDVNDPASVIRFVNQDGQFCASYGGTATNCSINLASFSTSPLGIHMPYNQQWNITLQREIGKGWALEMGYVGAQYVGGLGIWTPFLPRLASPTAPISVRGLDGVTYNITTNTLNNEALRTEALGLSRRRGARLVDNIGFANYHSGQVTVSHRFRGGLFFQGAYTWSKSIDNVSGSMSTDELNATRAGQAGANILNFQNDLSGNRARGDFDRPHRFVVSYTYELPIPKRGIWGTQVFQGWSVSGITMYQNGLPFSTFDATSGRAYGATGIGTGLLVCRPAAQQITTLPTCTPGTATTLSQVILTGDVASRLGNFLNPNMVSPAVAVPNAAGTGSNLPTGYGNIPRNAFRAPYQQNWDFTVNKAFQLHERHRLNFRADFFNLFNHPVFQTPSAVDVGTPTTFGLINNTAIPSRIIQFGLRYSF